jgi:hypothetical protein
MLSNLWEHQCSVGMGSRGMHLLVQVADDLNPLRCLSLLRAIPRRDCELLDHAGRPEDLLMLAVPVSSGTLVDSCAGALCHQALVVHGRRCCRLRAGASGCHPAVGGCGGRRLQRGRHHHEAHGVSVGWRGAEE